MKNVSGAHFIRMLVVTALVLTSGCEEPDISVDSLGKKFSAPQLKGTSPFAQDMDTNKYVRIQGICDKRVGVVSISFDKSNWFTPPSIPNYTGTTLAGTETNDLSCEGDGQFDIYMTDSDLTTMGVSTQDDVDYIYIKGSTIIGDTQILIIVDTDGDTGGGGPATHLVVEKRYPYRLAGTERCESLSIEARDANGNHAQVTSNVTFELQKAMGGGFSKISAYTNSSDCANGTGAQSSFTMTSTSNYMEIYYKFPNSPDSTISFQLSNVSLSTTTSPSIDVTIRSSSTYDRFWMSTYSNHRIRKGVCVRASYEARYYDGSYKSLYSGTGSAFTPFVSGTGSSGLRFYSDSSCSSIVSSISDSAPNNTFYMKYSDATADTTELTLTITHGLDGSLGTFDDVPHRIYIDRSTDTTPSYLMVHGNGSIQRGVCTEMLIGAANDRGALLGATGLTASLSSSQSGMFYSTSAACESNSATITNVSLSSSETSVYFRSVAAPGTTDKVTTSVVVASKTVSGYRDLTISMHASEVKAYFNSVSHQMNYPAAGGCIAMSVKVGLTDSLGGYAYTNNFSDPVTVGLQVPSSYEVFTDSGCTIQTSSYQNLAILVGAYQSPAQQFYIKAISTAIADTFYLSVPATPSYYLSTQPAYIVLY